MSEQAPVPEQNPRVGLLVTCLVDLFRPSVAFAAIKLLEKAGAKVQVPCTQTCCGQPAYNSGDRADAKAIARSVIESFEGFDYCVAPSGSCAAMLKHHYPALLADEPDYAERAAALAAKSFELTSFLVDVLGATRSTSRFPGSVVYHDSCSSLRELGISQAPRRLLAQVKDLELIELADNEVCCGFGGSFAVKYPAIANAIVEAKASNVAASGASCLVAGDLGCLMHIAGKLTRNGARVECRHVAEVLAGMTDLPPIGQAPRSG